MWYFIYVSPRFLERFFWNIWSKFSLLVLDMGSAPVRAASSNVRQPIIVWLDTSINDAAQMLNAQKSLQSSFDTVKTFNDENVCKEYIKSLTKNKIFLLSGARLGRRLIPEVHDLKQISSIYIYCWNKKRQGWTKDFNKVSQQFTTNR